MRRGNTHLWLDEYKIGPEKWVAYSGRGYQEKNSVSLFSDYAVNLIVPHYSLKKKKGKDLDLRGKNQRGERSYVPGESSGHLQGRRLGGFPLKSATRNNRGHSFLR